VVGVSTSVGVVVVSGRVVSVVVRGFPSLCSAANSGDGVGGWGLLRLLS